ncbi:hypothetical protein KCU71_g2944, partial [Aureobasidium melanogenum]
MGCGTKREMLPLEQTIVAMVYIFLLVFHLGWGPTVWVVTSKIATGPNRSKLFALSTGSNWFFNWVVSFSFPYLFNADAAGMGVKIGFLYGALTLCAVVWVYFLLPETYGLSLEQIQMAFEAGASQRTFKESALGLAASSEEELRHLPQDKGAAIAYEGHNTRVVVVSSFGHTLAPPSGVDFDNLRTANAGRTWQRYGQSKLADIFLAKSLAKHHSEITSVSVHPGLVRTQLISGVETSFMTPVFKLMRWTPLCQSADKGAYNVLWAATAPKDQIQNGMYYEPVGKVPGKAAKGSGQSELVQDEYLAERLWKWTETELRDFAQ